jgi:Spy/CpxP family protein refolding chaperone
MNKPWQVCLMLTGIYVFGGVCGGLVGYQIARRAYRHQRPPGEWMHRRIDRIDRELKLTPEQRARIDPIVKRHTEELTDAWRQSMTASRENVERMEKEIGAELTPEQRAQLDQFLQERRERFRKFMQEHGLRGGPGWPPGAPPDGDRPPPPPPPKSSDT